MKTVTVLGSPSSAKLLIEGLAAISKMDYADSYIQITIPWYLRPFKSKIKMIISEAWMKGAASKSNEEIN